MKEFFLSDEIVSNNGFAYASVFAGNFSLLLSIIIGIIATFLVLRSAKKLGGGLFGMVLNYMGIGMSFIVFGTIFSIIGPWLAGFWLNIVSIACFAMGYIFMVIGANKLLKGIMST
jgi:hypothetical protein